MASLLDFDFTSTIRDYDYTQRAIRNMNGILDSRKFQETDTDTIFEFLSGQMEIVSFKDYLKRYIFKKTDIPRAFRDVTDDVYMDIIMNSFQANQAPRSFEPTSKRWRATVRDWLRQATVKRSTIFLLGFGLAMTDDEVSESLTKVLQEEDIDFSNEQECVYWYCFHKGLPYSKAEELLQAAEGPAADMKENLWNAMRSNPRMYLGDEENLRRYLQYLKGKQVQEEKQQKALETFEELYRQCRNIIADIYNNEEDRDPNRPEITAADINPGDLEKMLCSGIPVNKSGNLQKMSLSLLSKQFQSRRMSRQRIAQILEKKHSVERFDLITLLFFIYATTVERDFPGERYMQYIDRINQILSEAGMMEIYPVNPYEAFVLMCLLTEEPLYSYGEVWELSYQEK